MNCDFHCHSTISDGLLAPADLVRRAAGNGVDVLALTDHDAIGGLDAARATAAEVGIGFVNGVEISIEWNETSVHIVGLGFDPGNAELAAGLAEISGGRIDRARRMAAELARIGIEGTFEGAMKYAENPSLISRAHFARYLVERGYCPDLRRVFETYLVPGKPGYVDHRWASLADSLRWIHAAGGVAVVAHPARYKINMPSLRVFLGEFRDLGGEAIEVTSGSHTPEQTQVFARIAREFGFLASRGSDFHGPDESYTDLGKLPLLPDDLKPVWGALGI
jgi:predicted metal-dependent phosphoesterase TrpH